MRYDPYGHGMPCPNRRSIRLKGYDYSQPGAYFVTIVTQERACLFGDVVDGEMRLNDTGKIVRQCWLDIPAHFPQAQLDAFVVMPNHVHGKTAPLRRVTLGQIVAYFKYQSAKRINERRGTTGASVWQRNYYEHIIRDDDELNRIRKYIANNPLQWELDRENPNVVGAGPAPAASMGTEPWHV